MICAWTGADRYILTRVPTPPDLPQTARGRDIDDDKYATEEGRSERCECGRSERV